MYRPAQPQSHHQKLFQCRQSDEKLPGAQEIRVEIRVEVDQTVTKF